MLGLPIKKQNQKKYQLFGAEWHLCITFLICRRGLALNVKAAKGILERKFDIYEENPFFKFSLFLIKIGEIRSK